MKIIAAYPSKTSQDPSGQNILVWPDSATVRSGKPVFLPIDGEVAVIPGIGAKIDSVGKSIQKRFALRYYKEIAPFLFILPVEVAQKLTNKEDPAACEIVSDYTVVWGDSIPAKETETSGRIEIEIKPLSCSDEEIKENAKFGIDSITDLVNESIAVASIRNTLKTGDATARLLSGFFIVHPDTLVKISINGTLLIENKLK